MTVQKDGQIQTKLYLSALFLKYFLFISRTVPFAHTHCFMAVFRLHLSLGGLPCFCLYWFLFWHELLIETGQNFIFPDNLRIS